LEKPKYGILISRRVFIAKKKKDFQRKKLRGENNTLMSKRKGLVRYNVNPCPQGKKSE
jgi:hypothetical protein